MFKLNDKDPRMTSMTLHLLITFKITVLQTEKALINFASVYQKYPENFAFQLFIILQ